MPVIRTSQQNMNAGHRPDWCAMTAAGVFGVKRDGQRFDCHFHDCHEYWLIYKGKAKVLTEGKEYYVQPGDIVCTKTGDEHDFLEVYEDVAAFWFEDATPEGGRIGHLHRDEVKAKGHDVPMKPIPEDFPA